MNYILILLIILLIYLFYNLSFIQEAFNNKTIVVHELKKTGFFSEFFFLCASYIYSKKNNFDMYINTSDWVYKNKIGWSDYFNSLLIEFNNSNHIADTIIKRGHNNDYKGQETMFTLKEYIDAIKNIFVLNNDILKRAMEYVETIGPNYYSLYIRRGDKITSGESSFISTDDILNYTDIKQNCKVLFVQTDDYSVVEEIQQILPNCTVHTLTPKNKNGSTFSDINKLKDEHIKKDTEELLISCIISINATKCWSDHRSNVGRFLKLYAFDKNNVFYYPPSPDKDKETYDTVIGPMWG